MDIAALVMPKQLENHSASGITGPLDHQKATLFASAFYEL
jgi:hypothetical protein